MLSQGPIWMASAVRQYGRAVIDCALTHDRHHHDANGGIYWLSEELEEAIGLCTTDVPTDGKKPPTISRIADGSAEAQP